MHWLFISHPFIHSVLTEHLLAVVSPVLDAGERQAGQEEGSCSEAKDGEKWFETRRMGSGEREEVEVLASVWGYSGRKGAFPVRGRGP